MKIRDFIGKVVISSGSGRRYVLKEITSPEIKVWAEHPNERGHRECYSFRTVNGDPISRGALIFEDASLTEAFKAAYSAHCQTRDAYYEEMEYWMHRG